MEDLASTEGPTRSLSLERATSLSDVAKTSGFSGLHRSDYLAFEDLSAVAHSVEAMPNAVFLLNTNGRVLFSNQEAKRLTENKDAICIDNGGFLRCKDWSAQQRLRRSLTRVFSGGFEGTCRKKVAFAIPRTDGRPLAVLLTYEPRAAGKGFKQQTEDFARIVLVLRDPQRQCSDTSEWLVRLYGLSEAEAIVADRLSTGASIDEIASERGVSVVTVRNQIKSATAKTGVNRQAELVSLVLRSTHF